MGEAKNIYFTCLNHTHSIMAMYKLVVPLLRNDFALFCPLLCGVTPMNVVPIQSHSSTSPSASILHPLSPSSEAVCRQFSTSVSPSSSSSSTSSSGKTKEELIEELSKDPEAKLILQELLRKEFDVSKNNDNSANDNNNQDLPVDSNEPSSGQESPKAPESDSQSKGSG